MTIPTQQLVAHPSTPTSAVCSIQAELKRDNGRLTIRYTLDGEVAALSLPEFSATERRDRLWEHSCFEIFLMETDRSSYQEYNFSSCGAWAHYRFNDYRQALPGQPDVPVPAITTTLKDNRFILTSCIALPDNIARLGLSAVIEDGNHELSYWALHHGREKPDFHDADAFTLALE